MIRQTVLGFLFITSSVMPAARMPAHYDRAAEKAITGTIKSVASYPIADGSVGVHLDLITTDGIVDVRIAPASFIGQHNFWFSVDDRVAIIGALESRDASRAVWAKAIQKGSAMLVMRDADGTPKWTPPTDGVDGCGVNHPPLQRGSEP